MMMIILHLIFFVADIKVHQKDKVKQTIVDGLVHMNNVSLSRDHFQNDLLKLGKIAFIQNLCLGLSGLDMVALKPFMTRLDSQRQPPWDSIIKFKGYCYARLISVNSNITKMITKRAIHGKQIRRDWSGHVGI